jgi:predicted ATPase
MRRYTITGGLGVGKTSVVSALESDFETVGEPARELIAEHFDATGEPTLDTRPELFVERLISRSIEKYHSVSPSRVTVFDRGLPDCVAYAAVSGLDAGAALDAASVNGYDNPVFVAGPWEEIYTTDNMRRATFAQAEAFYSQVVSVYIRLGYELVELPKVSVEERATFIRKHILQRTSN